jgi:hypothetical protein
MSPGLDTPNTDPAIGRSGIDDADKNAILAVLRAETAAWLRRDFAALAQHWAQSPQTRLMTSFPHAGARVFEGWDAIAAHYRGGMERHPQTYDIDASIRWAKVNVVLGGDMAWVSYDQIGSEDDDDF